MSACILYTPMYLYLKGKHHLPYFWFIMRCYSDLWFTISVLFVFNIGCVIFQEIIQRCQKHKIYFYPLTPGTTIPINFSPEILNLSGAQQHRKDHLHTS